jgi:unsaturated chondroitin disaccharide hydrolase
MWLFYAGAGQDAFREEALRTQKLLVEEILAFDALSHDVGFQYLLSTGANYKITGDTESARHTLHAATLLAGRFNPHGFLRAWNPAGKEGWAIVDCLMNLPLLYWAGRYTKDPRFEQIARIHADTSMRVFVRPDGSCNHIVIFDPSTGEMLDTPGGQGYQAGSSWSRGQAWALNGFVLSFLCTGEQRYLDTAKRIAHYFISNIQEDGLTACDFRQPPEPQRLDNIAAACASCGLIELAKCLPDEQKETYLRPARRMLRVLDEKCADYTELTLGVLQKCTASYGTDPAGEHINMVYGDYFFAEAVAKLCGIDPMLWI